MDVMITVTDESKLRITPSEQTIAVGGTVKLTASGDSATDAVAWTVTGDAVTLDKTAGLTVTATGAKAGTAAITATAEDGTTATATITVTKNGGGNGGGCNEGFGGMELLMLVVLACVPMTYIKIKHHR